MTFISYAQNFEDVLLWRALGHIKNGFYIDVGANDPEEHSVTRAFYDAGWYGINVEPLPQYSEAFRSQRPRDINLPVAAGSKDGSITLYDVASIPGWASPEASVAEMHRKDGHQVTELTVPVRTLAGICAEHVRGEIQFLKVDVEGHEAEVLRGMDFERFRPWVVVVEATLPNSRDSAHAAWEALLTAHRYTFTWFDGLNRYYVAEEHAELQQSFTVQPNVFDEFITHHLDKAWKTSARAHAETVDTHARLNEAQQRLGDTQQRLAEAVQRSDQAVELARATMESLAREQQAYATLAADHAHLRDHVERLREQQQQHLKDSAAQAERIHALSVQAAHDAHTVQSLHQQLSAAQAAGHHLTQWASELEQRLLATHRSTSWRITAPVRTAGSIIRRLRARPLRSPRALLRRVVDRAVANERMRRLVIPVLRRFPFLRTRASAMLGAIRQPVPEQSNAAVLAPDMPELPPEIKALPAGARRVAADLHRALGHTSAN